LPQNGFVSIESSQPSPTSDIKGCVFYKECPNATKACEDYKPELQVINMNEMVRCHYA